jgi:hypothetical protein
LFRLLAKHLFHRMQNRRQSLEPVCGDAGLSP